MLYCQAVQAEAVCQKGCPMQAAHAYIAMSQAALHVYTPIYA